MSQVYFAYGFNMCLQQMKSRCPQGELIGGGALPGYRWIINARGYANVVLADDEQVEGLVFFCCLVSTSGGLTPMKVGSRRAMHGAICC
nr:gamma-glutamylcyclotransferase family protein [uncultured Desulfobulbus sp.]